MKILYSLFALLLFAGALPAQSEYLQEFFDKYQSHNSVDEVELRAQIIDQADDLLKEDSDLLEKLSYLRILVMEDENAVDPADYRSLMAQIEADDYEELLHVRSEDTQVHFYLQEEGEKITDLVFVVNDATDFVLIFVQGDFDYNDLLQLSLDPNQGINSLRELTNDLVQVYPNPNYGPEYTIQREAGVQIQQIRILDANGRLIDTISGNENTFNLNGNGLFFVEITTNQGVVTRKVIRN
ncbi:MAG: DUF4252 domain-containing protein [Saprospiraceae bacterium]|nr:DUF4252 domain-containing protein [Saprospiraceae bacterium]MCB0676924.1 DUF4252 domain-containing protein [Saprospiraceae bacterium]MCB0682920.1 DUF4252 domain-containing protein [Saprospiraceae bacterium]